ncbi:transporter substrate-binding domain-containing protein, partial [Salmonella enterica subsp. enterica serovar Virginia]|nr:transporter substrate-binding domain-containing protein [Salmonella enterica subsp. enterica serovar Virginia]
DYLGIGCGAHGKVTFPGGRILRTTKTRHPRGYMQGRYLESQRVEFIGFDIDLGNEMCKRMQVKCTWVASDFDALIPSLKAKKIDA